MTGWIVAHAFHAVGTTGDSCRFLCCSMCISWFRVLQPEKANSFKFTGFTLSCLPSSVSVSCTYSQDYEAFFDVNDENIAVPRASLPAHRALWLCGLFKILTICGSEMNALQWLCSTCTVNRPTYKKTLSKQNTRSIQTPATTNARPPLVPGQRQQR